MRNVIMMLSTALAVFPCLAASVNFGNAWQRFMPSALGDARTAGETVHAAVTNLTFSFSVPEGTHTGLTVCVWTRLTTGTGAALTNKQVVARMFYTPEAVRTDNPSLAFADAQGWPTNMTLAGTVSKDPFPFQPYEPGVSSNAWPKGVYTVAGESSNAVTVSLGGNEVTVGPGEFNRNVIGGAGTACAATGTGWAKIGVSRCPDAEFFELDGTAIIEAQIFFQPWAMITNELKMVAMRLCLNGARHAACVDYFMDDGSHYAVTNERAMPRRARALSSDGMYRINFVGVVKKQAAYDAEFFDYRVFTRLLSEDELRRIHGNGAEEIARRGIPRWK